MAKYLDLTGLSHLIDKLNIPNITNWYGTCATAAATAKKESTIDGFPTTLTTGLRVNIKFTYANGVASPTLSINGGEAINIKRYGTTAPSTSAASSWNAGAVVTFIYDGTNWIMADWINTTYSGMTDAEYKAGTSTTNRLITPARLKSAIEYFSDANVIETVKQNGTALSVTNKAVDVIVPTKTSDLVNDSGFITSADVSAVTGVKGDSESSYRTGNVNITKANIGLGSVENKSSATIRGELTSSNVTTALGFTPYNSTNPNGYQANVIESVKRNGTALTITSKSVDITVPTKTSELTNDSGYITNAGVTGVKGNSESSYRTGNVNITPANIGAVPTSDVISDNTSPYGKIPIVKSDGVIELGKYIDFHLTNGDTDYALRVTAAADGLTLSGQSLTGSSGKLMTAGDFADRVIETGTTGSWAYRKWAGGKIEAWRTVTVTASATTQVGSVYRSSATVDLPSGLFSKAPHLIATMDADGTNLFQVQAHATSATNINVKIWRVNASSSTYGVDTSFYAWRG